MAVPTPSNETQVRDFLVNAYLDYANEYITVEKFAEHNGLYIGEAQEFIDMARRAYTHAHPEA